MAIQSSSAREVEQLIEQLRTGTALQREAAVARLRVIGPRAVGRLTALVRAGAPTVARVAALKALEGVDDRRALDTALRTLHDADRAVAVAAVAAARVSLSSSESGAAVLDAFTTLVVDRGRDPVVRAAALDALAQLPRKLVQPLLQRIGAEDPAIAARLTEDSRAAPLDQPGGIRDWLALRGTTAPLSQIHDLVVTIHDRERREPSVARRREWQVARGAAHGVLAQRGSRVALYDLRESFDGAPGPLPLDFLNAAACIGDRSCLEPLARAWAAASADHGWRERLSETARVIVAREKLTARHRVMKRIRSRWPGFLD